MRRVDAAEVHVTRHAGDVIRRRGIPWSVIAAVLEQPDVIEPHKGQFRFVGQGIAAVIADDGFDRPALVTVLLRDPARWNDATARARFEGDPA